MPDSTFEQVHEHLRTAFYGSPTDTRLRLVVGVDGGIDGAIAWNLADGEVTVYAAVLDLPVVADPGSARAGRQALDLIELYRWLHTSASVFPTSIVIERFMPIPAGAAAAMRDKSPDKVAEKIAAMEASNVRLAGTVGELRGLAAAVAVSARARVLSSPTPAQWRKAIGQPHDAPKDVYRATALRLFVALAERLRGKTHHNRAEALLISEYGKGAKS